MLIVNLVCLTVAMPLGALSSVDSNEEVLLSALGDDIFLRITSLLTGRTNDCSVFKPITTILVKISNFRKII
jgi:hypothetical protein